MIEGFELAQINVTVFRKPQEEWFIPERSAMALWWPKSGSRPKPAEALARLRFLREKGPSPKAFTFKEQFEPA